MRHKGATAGSGLQFLRARRHKVMEFTIRPQVILRCKYSLIYIFHPDAAHKLQGTNCAFLESEKLKLLQILLHTIIVFLAESY